MEIWISAPGTDHQYIRPITYSINESAWTDWSTIANRVPIPDNPGATEQFTIKIRISVPANTTAINRIWEIGSSAYAEDDLIDDFVEGIIQLAATSTVSVNPKELELVNAGTAKTVSIISNDDWVLS